MAETSGQPPAARGAAWRRRQRRLRSMLRHERQTVRMELSWLQPFTTAGVEGSGRTKAYGHRRQPARVLPSTSNFPLTMAGPRVGCGRRPCWSRGRRRGTGGTWGSGMRSPRSRGPCAADGGTDARRPPVLRHFSAGGCRAGYRSAEDLPGQDSAALGGSSAPAADGGTVGGCADCRVLFFSPAAYCRADRRHSSSRSRWGRGFAGQGSTASSSHVGAADGAGQGFFSHFSPKEKSAKQGPHSGSELSADFNPSTLSAHQMTPEQLVDVPVPQVHERSSRSLVYEQGTRFLESLHRRWEAEEAARLALLEEEQMDEEEEEEEVEVSRFLLHFRPRFALVDGTAHLHTMSLSFIQTHGSALCWWMVGPGSRGLASPWTLPGCPCRFSGAG